MCCNNKYNLTTIPTIPIRRVTMKAKHPSLPVSLIIGVAQLWYLLTLALDMATRPLPSFGLFCCQTVTWRVMWTLTSTCWLWSFSVNFRFLCQNYCSDMCFRIILPIGLNGNFFIWFVCRQSSKFETGVLVVHLCGVIACCATIVVQIVASWVARSPTIRCY